MWSKPALSKVDPLHHAKGARAVEDSPWRSAEGESIIHLPIVCIAQASFFHRINTPCASHLCTMRAAAECDAVDRRRGLGFVPPIRRGFPVCTLLRLAWLFPDFAHSAGKIINRIPRREGIKSQKADRVLSGFCLRMRYRIGAQAHSLAQEELQLFGFSTSLVDIPSKVAEVLAFVENVPWGQIRRTELKPRATNAPAGFRPVSLCYS